MAKHGTIGVRLSPERRNTLKKIAAIEGRSVSNLAARRLDQCIRTWEAKQPAETSQKDTTP